MAVSFLGGFIMTYVDTIQGLIDSGKIESVLKRGSRNKKEVQALQTILHELGFDKELNWERWGADGGYGGGTVNAVKSFAEKNGLSGTGQNVTKEIGKSVLARFDIVDDLKVLNRAIEKDKLDSIRRGARGTLEIVAIQTLLNALGYGEELGWAKYGADGQYGGGTSRALKAFANKKGIKADGNSLTKPLAEAIRTELANYFGGTWDDDKEEEKAEAESVVSSMGELELRSAVVNKRARIFVSEKGKNEVRFNKFKKGVYFYGQQKAIDFMNANKQSLSKLGLTESVINVMIAVSENEGNLDAINTWDNSYMTFGMFQWTIGAGTAKGELPALLKKIKQQDKAVFDKYYGQYGLDIVDTDDVYGYLTLNGAKVDTVAEKEKIRTVECAYRFWRSGQDPTVMSIEIQHAQSRLGSFYKSDRFKVGEHYLADLLTSEYAVGLILDNHVNRPGYLKACVEMAMGEVKLGDPKSWTTDDEMKLVNAYLKVRETYGKYPMTHADKRAAVTKKYLDKGIISAERHSFQYLK